MARRSSSARKVSQPRGRPGRAAACARLAGPSSPCRAIAASQREGCSKLSVGGYARGGGFAGRLPWCARAWLIPTVRSLFDRETRYGRRPHYPDTLRFASLARFALQYAGRARRTVGRPRPRSGAALAPVYLKTLYASHPGPRRHAKRPHHPQPRCTRGYSTPPGCPGSDWTS